MHFIFVLISLMLGIQKIFILFDVFGIVVSTLILSRCIGFLNKKMLKIEHMLWKWLILGIASLSFLMS
jgi:hypothetical protein